MIIHFALPLNHHHPPLKGLSWAPWGGRPPAPRLETSAEIRRGCENNDTLIVKLPFSRLRCREQTQSHMKEQSLHWLHPWYLWKAKSFFFFSLKQSKVCCHRWNGLWLSADLINHLLKIQEIPCHGDQRTVGCSCWITRCRFVVKVSCFWETEAATQEGSLLNH